MSSINELRQQVHKFVDNASVKELEIVYHLLEVNTDKDWWDEISVDHQNAIAIGLEQLDKGKGIPHKEVLKNYEQWLKK